MSRRLSEKVCIITGTGGSMGYLTKPADCQALVDFAVGSYGRIDVLFNNAAMASS